MNINSIADNSIQETSREKIVSNPSLPYFIFNLSSANDLISKWWSKGRDIQLRNFWKSSDQLAGAINAVVSRMVTIPFRVVPRDMSIKAHAKLAEEYTEYLLNFSEIGEGWNIMYQKFVEDFLTQDNGAFLEVIGDGDKKGAIRGAALGLAHLDSSRCTRTGNPIYPVVYTDTDGKQYKLHFSRVIYASQMPSPIKEMNGVGYCAVSRAINAAQNLVDISIYKQEKLGSRAQRQLMITRGGLDPDDLNAAIMAAEAAMTAKGLRRFSKSIAVGSALLPDADLKTFDLASLPDGFDEENSTFIGMSMIALAFGIDVREIYPITNYGGTKADAIIQHIKQRGKTVGQLIEITEANINNKFLPPFLKMVYDFQDDAQDRQEAEIRNIRAIARQRDITMTITSVRVEREKMMQNGEITREQFEELELEDGRMPDGVSVDVLFFDPMYSEFLSDINESNYLQKMDNIMLIISTSKSPDKIRKARYSLAAIKNKYMPKEKYVPVARNSRLGGLVEMPGQDLTYQNDKYTTLLERNPTSAPDDIGAINK